MKTNANKKRYDCLISALECPKAMRPRRERNGWLGWVIIIQLIQTLYRSLRRDHQATFPTPVFSSQNDTNYRLIWIVGLTTIAIMMIVTSLMMIILKFYFYSS